MGKRLPRGRAGDRVSPEPARGRRTPLTSDGTTASSTRSSGVGGTQHCPIRPIRCSCSLLVSSPGDRRNAAHVRPRGCTRTSSTGTPTATTTWPAVSSGGADPVDTARRRVHSGRFGDHGVLAVGPSISCRDRIEQPRATAQRSMKTCDSELLHASTLIGSSSGRASLADSLDLGLGNSSMTTTEGRGGGMGYYRMRRAPGACQQ